MPAPALISVAWALAEMAPSLIRYFKGDTAGEAAERAVDIAKQVTGKDDAVDALAALRASPDKVIEFQAAIASTAVEFERIAASDRGSAREREAKTGDTWTPRILAATVIGGFFWTLWMVFSGRVRDLTDPVMVGLAGTLIGYVSAKADQVVSYYFGSSAGSERKNVLLDRMMK